MSRKRTLTIRRPDGRLEVVDVTKRFAVLTDQIVERIRDATAKAGRGDVLSWAEEIIDDRTAAEKAYDAVRQTEAQLEAAEAADYYDPERVAEARRVASRARANWAAKYPAEAKAQRAQVVVEEAARRARIERSTGYQNKLAGRD
jgi:hypothetical protein